MKSKPKSTKRRRKKAPRGKVENLGADQLQFIHAKVVELGSVEAVAHFYNKDCAVDEFARACAKNLYG